MKRSERHEQANQAQARLQLLAATGKKMQQAALAYEKKMLESGSPLVPGTAITLTDLEQSGDLPPQDPSSFIKIQNFTYALLSAEALAEATQMELVTDQGRVTVTKAGEGKVFGNQ
jgi:hypothetical protein